MISGWPEEWQAAAFLVLVSVQHFLLLAMIPWPAIALGILVAPRPAVVVTLGIICAAILACVLAVDTVVLNLFRFHLNGMVWSLLVNGGVDEIITLSRDTYAVAFAVVGAILLAELAVAWAAWRWVRRPGRRMGKHTIAAAVLLAIMANVIFALAHAMDYTPITRLERTLPAYSPLTANRTLRKLGFKIQARPGGANVRPETKGLRYPLEPLHFSPQARPLNVVVIVIDGWRDDMLSPKAAPNIEAFARENIRFMDHSAAARCTRFGIFSLFYGLYGTYWDAMLLEQRGPALLDELDRLHYQFGLFGSASLSNPEFDRTVFSRVRSLIPPHLKGRTVLERDVAVTDDLIRFIQQRDQGRPFLGFAFYDSTHAYDYPPSAPAPFQPACASVNHLKLNNSTDPVPLRNRYLNSVHYVDQLAARVLKALGDAALLDSTIVIVTGDHGEEFNETGRNYWGHGSNFSRFQTRVPFVMHWPGRAPAVVSHATSHLDFAPTLMQEMLGCKEPLESYSNGLNLFDPTPRLPLVVSSWKCLAMQSPGRIDVLYASGYNEHFDEQYRDLRTPVPASLLRTTLQGMNRFFPQ